MTNQQSLSNTTCADCLSVRKVLELGVTIKREEHFISGARRCAYRVRSDLS